MPNLQIGLVHFMAFPDAREADGSLLESLHHLALDPFWGCIELKAIASPQVEAQVAALFAGSHIDLLVGSQYTLLSKKLNLNSLDASLRQQSVDTIKRDLEQASRLGAKGLAVLSGPVETAGPDAHRRATEALIDSLAELAEYAVEVSHDRSQPLWLELETFDDNIDKKSLVGPSSAAAELAAEVTARVDNFGLLLDLSHLPLLGESSHHALETTAPFLTHLHIGNCLMRDEASPLYGDFHPPFGYPGSENDVEEVADFLSALLAIGYPERKYATRCPTLSFEVKPVPGQDPWLLLADNRRVLEAAWQLLEED